MATKPKQASNIFSGKATIRPPGESIEMQYDKIKSQMTRSHKKKVSVVIPKSTGKPATILYKKLPDNMILITGFDNFLSTDEVFEKYGLTVAKAYFAYPSHMSGSFGALSLSGMINCSILVTGHLCSKDGFSKIISHVKKCGSLLHDIIIACDFGEVKQVQI